MQHPKIVTWIVVANGARAHILQQNRKGNGVHEVLPYDLIGRNLPTRERVSDRAGMVYDRRANASHAMAPRSDAHRHDKLQFARALAAELMKHAETRAFCRLILVAPPQTLGDLRGALPEKLRGLVEAEVPKDLTQLSLPAVHRQLAESGAL